MGITLDGDFLTEHFRSKKSDLGEEGAILALVEGSSISQDDARLVICGLKRFSNDDKNNVILVDEKQ